ncbi:extensin-like [Iris pallida]|uniref:Extensin-like n=1 Tax=Iris pallida TaxID=29817 RepID=A0AAX6GGX5_IRIPA|nr:extensin-like [Iris pallida]KAJ6827547.1 extensin-like [Iris pallida]
MRRSSSLLLSLAIFVPEYYLSLVYAGPFLPYFESLPFFFVRVKVLNLLFCFLFTNCFDGENDCRGVFDRHRTREEGRSSLQSALGCRFQGHGLRHRRRHHPRQQ